MMASEVAAVDSPYCSDRHPPDACCSLASHFKARFMAVSIRGSSSSAQATRPHRLMPARTTAMALLAQHRHTCFRCEIIILNQRHRVGRGPAPEQPDVATARPGSGSGSIADIAHLPVLTTILQFADGPEFSEGMRCSGHFPACR